MINLDDIQARLDRGQATEGDVQSMLAETANQSVTIPQPVADRLGRGYRNPADVNAIFGLLEAKYAVAFSRPTRAQKVAADLAAQQAAIASAQAAMQTASSAQALAEATQHQSWIDNATQAQSAQQAAVQAQAAADRFRASQASAAEALADRHDKAQRLQDVLNG